MFQFALFHHFSRIYQHFGSVLPSKVSIPKTFTEVTPILPLELGKFWAKSVTTSPHVVARFKSLYCVSMTNQFSEYLFYIKFACISVFFPENLSRHIFIII